MRLFIIKILLLLLFVPSAKLFAQDEKNTQDKIEEIISKWVIDNITKNEMNYNSRVFLDFEENKGLTDEENKVKEKVINLKYKMLTNLIMVDTAVIDQQKLKEVDSLNNQIESFEEKVIGYRIKHNFSYTKMEGEKETVLFYECEFTLNKLFEIQESTVKESYANFQKDG